MLAGSELLARADERAAALAGFTAYNLETALGIVRAGEALGVPLILQAGSSAFKLAGRHPLAALALALARQATVPVGVHLDHSRDLAELGACLQLGYTSVMVDGSSRPFDDNVAFTLDAVRLAREAGAWIEAELGALAGDEDVSTDAVAGDGMTDPDAAGEFVTRTGVDALAVAIGNVHGFTPEPVQLDLDRLSAIRDRVRVPLVLHGASGLRDGDVQRAIGLGIRKVNVNAELRRGLFAALPDAVAAHADGYDLAGLAERAAGAVQAAAQDRLRVLGWTRKEADG